MPVRRQYQPIGNIVTPTGNILNNNYTNNSGQALLVLVTVEVQTNAAPDSAYVTALINAVSVGNVGLYGMPAGVYTLRLVIPFIVPVGAIYRVNSFVAGGGTVILRQWIETTLIAPFSAGF